MKSIGKLLTLTTVLLMAIGLIVLFGMSLFDQDSVEGFTAISQFFEQQKLLFTVFRMSLLAIVFWHWESFINWLSKMHQWEEEMRLIIIDARWKILAWFVVFEIMINQNLIGFLLN
ncbi:MAG: hypothetical protein KZQ70_14585 [gamma proteobacterium symbiont of Lucinoma myriamae]|nr:hypothetical protein [gamma proteobacterium symbiont of Lucinoma myriamae]MCU7817951.1 hypothetical protein [gamma proteobacterium symbiont of Lucinoma myriamae]